MDLKDFDEQFIDHQIYYPGYYNIKIDSLKSVNLEDLKSYIEEKTIEGFKEGYNKCLADKG